MVMIRAIIRPEKVDETLKTLADAGYPAVTKIEVYGRSTSLDDFGAGIDRR